MYYPNVQFHLNKTLDKKTVIRFLGFNVGGVNFADGILGVHPSIKKAIFHYIDNFYKERQSFLHEVVKDFERKWRLKEKSFFDLAAPIFRNHPWPKGKYIGYISIFDCNPRFLNDKTFQIFYRHKSGPVYVTAHELLHFIFFDYIEKKREDLRNRLTENELWRISEIVNEILHSSSPLKEIFDKQIKYEGYPEFRRITSRIKNKLKGITNIDKLLDLIALL